MAAKPTTMDARYFSLREKRHGIHTSLGKSDTSSRYERNTGCMYHCIYVIRRTNTKVTSTSIAPN